MITPIATDDDDDDDNDDDGETYPQQRIYKQSFAPLIHILLPSCRESAAPPPPPPPPAKSSP